MQGVLYNRVYPKPAKRLNLLEDRSTSDIRGAHVLNSPLISTATVMFAPSKPKAGLGDAPRLQILRARRSTGNPNRVMSELESCLAGCQHFLRALEEECRGGAIVLGA